MLHYLKKAAVLLICCAVISGAASVVANEIPMGEQEGLTNQDIGINVNGQLLQLDVKPFIENGRTLIPLRGVMQKLGAEVAWYEERAAVGIYTDTIDIELSIGADTAKVTRIIDGLPIEEALTLDVPAKIVEGRTFIPIRFVAEALGSDVGWNEAKRMVTVEGGKNSFKQNEDIGESLAEMGKAIPVDKVKNMVMYSLSQEKIKEFTQDEINEIVDSLNTSPTFLGAHILMLAGNSITITLENDENIQLTSFGSKDYVVLSGEVNGEMISACIISPKVGSILLSDSQL